MNLKALAEPFKADDIEWRIGQAGQRNGKPWAKVLAYIRNRAVQQRLDDVCGPENWRNEFSAGPQGGVICGISIRTSDGWVTKWDGAENTEIESIKGGLSDSMKRAAVQWGIGRYLYYLDEGWANIHENGSHYSRTKEGAFNWDPPQLPSWALPSNKNTQEKPKEQPKAAAPAKQPVNKEPAKPAPSKASDESASHAAFAFTVNKLIEQSGHEVDAADLFKVTLAQMDCEDLCYVENGCTFGDLKKLRKCEDEGVFSALIVALKRQIAELSMSNEYKEFRKFAEDMVAKAKHDDVQIWPQGINSVMEWLIENKVFANREDLTKCRDVRKFATARGKVEQFQLENSREVIEI